MHRVWALLTLAAVPLLAPESRDRSEGCAMAIRHHQK